MNRSEGIGWSHKIGLIQIIYYVFSGDIEYVMCILQLQVRLCYLAIT